MTRSIAFILVLMPTAAWAMNWEGHEDGPSSHPYETVLKDMLPEARPLPSGDCPVTPEMVAANPYLQIPLPRHNCKPRRNTTEGER
jgi:hypothetical protein